MSSWARSGLKGAMTDSLKTRATQWLNPPAVLGVGARSTQRHKLVAVSVVAAALSLLPSATLFAHGIPAAGIASANAIVEQVAFDPPTGAVLPADALFADEHGTVVHLTDFVRATPAIVVPAYYSCSNLCSVVLQGLAQGLASAGLHAGRDLQVIVFSIAPADTPALALQKKREVLGDRMSDEAAGWHFLTGREPAIQAATHALGYRYAYDPEQHEYAHAAGVVVVSGDARVVQTLFGAEFPADALRAALSLAARTERGTLATNAPSRPDARIADARSQPGARSANARLEPGARSEDARLEPSPRPEDARSHPRARPAEATSSIGVHETAFAASNSNAIAAPPAAPDFARKWLLCFHYDPHTGRYSFAAMNAVRCAALLALFALCGYVISARLREHRSRSR